MRFINLNKITADRGRDRYHDGDEDAGPAETVEVSINIAAIRCFYARKEGREGTRLTFTDGGGFAVSNPPGEVQTRISGATAGLPPAAF
jgi:hypothetical protein